MAHQGGWDELIVVGVPVLAFGALLMVANRRAASLEARRAEEGGEPGEH